MKLALLGATGKTGQHLLKQALDAGHEVTAIVRSPSKIELQHEHLRVVQGDVMYEHTLIPGLKDQDALLFVLGSENRREPTTLYSEGVKHLINAMESQNIQRLIGVSASGFINDPQDRLAVKYLFKPLLQRMLKPLYGDLQRMEAVVKASHTDWTLIRPARLSDGPHTGTYRTDPKGIVSGGKSISRADVADFMLKTLQSPQLMVTAVGVAY